MNKTILKQVFGRNIVDIIHTIYPFSYSKIKLLLIKHKFKSFGRDSTVIFPCVFWGYNNISIGDYSDIGAFTHIWVN